MNKIVSTFFLFIYLFTDSGDSVEAAELPRFFQPQSFSYISDIIPAADNGFTVLGYFKNAPTDLYVPQVVKFDQRGEVQWQKRFENLPLLDFSAVDEGGVYRTPDNGYLLVNTYPSPTNNGRYGIIRKYNASFDSVYTVFTGTDSIGLDETFLNGWNLAVNKIVPTADGGFAIAGSNLADCYNKGYILAKYSSAGGLVWKEKTPLTNGCVQFRYDAAVSSDANNGGFLFGIANREMVALNVYKGIYNIVRKNPGGGSAWLNTITTDYDVSQVANKNVLLTQKQLSDGRYKLLTLYDVSGGNYTGGTFLQYTLSSDSGKVVQTDTFNFILPMAGSENLRKVIIDKDENIIILGQKSISKLDNKGRIIWQRAPFDELRIYDNPSTKYHLTCYAEAPEGNYIVAGNGTQTTNNNNSTVALFYISADGRMRTKIIYGGVFADIDNNCMFTANERGYQNLVVKAEKYNQTFYTLTDSAGLYNLPVDTGIYNVSVQLPNSLFWRRCQPSYAVNLTSTNPSINVNLPIQPTQNCPFLNVEVSTPYLRKCFPNTYGVYYCNNGNDTAYDAYITIDFDSDLQVNGSSLPWSNVIGTKYRFDIGKIAPQACGSFTVNATVNCAAPDGKTHCVTAHIYPDAVCMPDNDLWDGSNIVVEGTCIGDSAVFRIKNVGTGNMVSPRKYIVIEGDFLRVAPQNYQLNANDSLEIRLAVNGRTVRVEAFQDPNFPYPSYPAVVIEGCNGTIDSAGLVNQFPQDDRVAAISTSCLQNRSSYDPNEKSAQPVGYQDRHIVSKETEIKYTLHFQNTGTDTAFSIVLLDTISTAMDMTTLVMGASSHPYTYAVFGGNIVQINFTDIRLPDSSVNSHASNGFVTFHLLPKASTPKGTLVENRAHIYFDYNAPLSTNLVYHTIDSIQLRVTAVVTNKSVLSEVMVYPNPFSDKAVIQLKSFQPLQDIVMKVYDVSGRMVQNRSVTSRVELDGIDFVNGMYLLQFVTGNEIIATAKLIRQ
ncbi:MAG: T9SS type A sorting domain-containing protein [Sphingobacteriales bacterium]|nr:T9SS type A sorting domain-containing protein [Sphingobacteriales bacterium]